MTIRFAEPADDARLASIDAATWSPAVSPGPAPSGGAFFRPGVEPADTLVATSDGEIAAYALLGPPTPLPASAHVLMVRGLAVAPEFQRRGIAGALIERALDVARSRGARKVSLRVLASNVGARTLYEACGFTVEGVLRGEFFLDGHDVDDVFMARSPE